MNLHPGWFLVATGLVLVAGGLLLVFAPGLPLGRLPGDIRIESEHTRVYIPVTTCLVLSLLLSAVLWLVRWLSQ